MQRNFTSNISIIGPKRSKFLLEAVLLLEAEAAELWETRRESKMHVSFFNWKLKQTKVWPSEMSQREKDTSVLHLQNKKCPDPWKKKYKNIVTNMKQTFRQWNLWAPCRRWSGGDFPEWPKAVCCVPEWAGVNNQKTDKKKNIYIYSSHLI